MFQFKVILVLLFILTKTMCFCQNKILVSHKIEQQLPSVFAKSDRKPLSYKHQGDYHVSEILLFPDSSFFYYFLSVSRYDFTIGKYSAIDGLITLNWDSLKTFNCTKDSACYGKYFKLKRPLPFKITNKVYCIKSNSLELIKFKFSTKKNELYTSCNSFLNEDKVIAIDPTIQIKYNIAGDKLIVKNSINDIGRMFPKDSIWGYKTCTNWDCYLYRIAPKGINWYGYSGVQIDDLIIYTIGPGYMYCYFSKNLTSKIHPLNRSGITEAFKENKSLQEIILKKADKLSGYSAINENTDCFKIIEIYKNALQQIKQ
jgi:hypothetical protein